MTIRMALVALLLSLSPAASAQSSAPAAALPDAAVSAAERGQAVEAVPGVILLVREEAHARAALRTADALRTRPRFAGAPIELVVCGGGSRSLLRDAPAAAELVAEAERTGVRLLACGMSLGKLGIAPADLAAGVGVVENGLLHALERQADGYLSVEL